MEQMEWELLGESKRIEVDRLIEFYKKDKAKAKVIYHQDKTKYHYNRIILFKKPNGNFDIVNFLVTYGISCTGIIYHRQRRFASIIYKDKKFYTTNCIKGHKNFTQLNFFGLDSFINSSQMNRDFRFLIYKIMMDKFSWMRWVEENEELHDMCFNTIMTHKLKNPSDCLRHRYGVPINIAKIVQSGRHSNHGGEKGNRKVWKEMKKVLEGIQNLKEEIYNHHLFMDTCKMAGALGRKVNCSWGLKRIKEEHDKWSKEITKIVLEYAELQKLNVSKLYLGFAAYSRYKILRTNKEMIYEGKRQNHCVATYISSVDNGSCAIYHVNGYTLQLKEPNSWNSSLSLASKKYIDGTMKDEKKEKLVIAQFKGLNNTEAPKELKDEVQAKINEFSQLESYEELLTNFPEVPDNFNLTDDDLKDNEPLLYEEIMEMVNEDELPF